MEGNMKKVGLAIQGGGFPAGAFAAGVISGLVTVGAFDPKKIFPNKESYDILRFFGHFGRRAGCRAVLGRSCRAPDGSGGPDRRQSDSRTGKAMDVSGVAEPCGMDARLPAGLC